MNGAAQTGNNDRGKGWQLPLALVLIGAVTLAVYWPVLGNGFIDFDDDIYVTSNMVVSQGLTLQGLLWSLTTFTGANWHPLTWLSHMLDVQLFGMNPAGHHAMSLVIHCANALLLFILLRRLTGFVGRSLFVALLFAVHPLHVESVAWVAERKDLLSTLFWFLTIRAYCGYVKKPGAGGYIAVSALFALGLMAKQMPVTLPLVLLLMDYWPLKRLAGSAGVKFLCLEKVPLLLISAAASLLIIRAHASAGALFEADRHSLLLHSGNAIISYVKYICSMFVPVDLALFYPFEASAVTPAKVAGAALILVLISVVAVVQRKSRPYLFFGWFWYLITLLPVIGFFRVGGQALADRYTYIPLVGIFILIAWGAGELAGRWRSGGRVAAVAAAFVVALLGAAAFRQVGYWKSSYDLYSHALAVVEGNWLAHNNMGILLSQHNRNEEAIAHFKESVRLNPGGIEGFRNLGNSLQMAGRYAEAVDAYRRAVWLAPQDPEGHFRLGYAYLLSGSADLATQEYNQLVRMGSPNAGSLLQSIEVMGRR